MDINKYMETSLAHQHRANELLAAILAKLSEGETVQIRVPVETAAAIAGKGEGKTEDKPTGSAKQQKNVEREDKPEDKPKATGKPPSAEDVRSALMALGKREGSQAAIDLLQKYGSTSVSGLAEDDYAKLIEDAQP